MNHKAFTLIELLVVVLIIGILSAIALPQYTQAVEKSRAAEALSNIGSFKKAVDIWKLANPDKARGFTGDLYGVGELDISVPDDWTEDGTKSCSKNFCYEISTNSINAYRINSSYIYEIKYWPSDNTYECWWYSENPAGKKLCKSFSDMGQWGTSNGDDF